MKLSFKLKIALLSLAISGTLLTAFGTLFFAFNYRAGIDRMDQEIRTLAESSLRGPRPHDYWENFQKSLDFIYGDQARSRIAFCVVGEARFFSENAPTELKGLAVSLKPEARREDFEVPLINRLDRNKDGHVTLDEFDGAAGDFVPIGPEW
ncbi:hypothetical protein SH580_04960 [Coraliomargarita algicola]|uniref:EF-hand domain-containing protein n=1 Tax=Coraliomargarita algicola TaxID=3092156 RepID=A0ABZ0RVQ3_9BACT|nr:hypothetical protein [Coraliomargarita sp. J2-16]WPJ97054.1 hypothetical protein SH580_04960 [Coraliomargarita sp. J2-16]